MSPDLKKDITKIIKTIPFFIDRVVSTIKIEPLSGITNHNYQLTVENDVEQYVLRIPKHTTNPNMNRQNEAYNTEIAQQLDLSPTVMWRENSKGKYTGISLSRLILDTSPINEKNASEYLHTIAEKLVILQTSHQPFMGELSVQTIQDYLHHYFSLCTISQKNRIDDRYKKALHILKRIEVNKTRLKTVPCHGDLVLENILLNDNKMWLIDWEYSVMASPYWDIATVCHSAKFDKKTAQLLLQQILPSAGCKEVETLLQYQYIVKVLEQLWRNAFEGQQ